MTYKFSLKHQVLICLAVTCQFISCLNFYSINNYLKVSEGVFGDQLDGSHWVIFSFFGRLLGVCILGKYAERFGFFKTIQVISGLFVIFATLFFLFCFVHHSYHVNFDQFYYFRLYYCFLEPAAIFLPAIYLFKVTSPSRHIILSAVIIFAVFLGQLGAYFLKFIQLLHPTAWAVVPVITTSLSWIIYGYLQNDSKKNQELNVVSQASIADIPLIPVRVKIISTLLGGALAAALFYNHTYFSHYISDIALIDSRFNISGVSYYSLFALFFIPGAVLTRRFGFLPWGVYL